MMNRFSLDQNSGQPIVQVSKTEANYEISIALPREVELSQVSYSVRGNAIKFQCTYATLPPRLRLPDTIEVTLPEEISLAPATVEFGANWILSYVRKRSVTVIPTTQTPGFAQKNSLLNPPKRASAMPTSGFHVNYSMPGDSGVDNLPGPIKAKK